MTSVQCLGVQRTIKVLILFSIMLQISCYRRCPVHRFGLGCKYQCRCSSGDPCEISSGICPQECEPNWHGISCNRTDCPLHRHGPTCRNFCFCRHGDQCDMTTGQCLDGCELGMVGVSCDKSLCDQGKYNPPLCDKTCHYCGSGVGCSAKEGHCITNTCPADDKGGPHCSGNPESITCPRGKYGKTCDLNCNCNTPDSLCDRDTGICNTGTQYTAEMYLAMKNKLHDSMSNSLKKEDLCEESGVWGNGCIRLCKSPHCLKCDRRDGAVCFQCQSGYHVTKVFDCEFGTAPCSEISKWGPDCSATCRDRNCVICDQATGLHCLKCAAGYFVEKKNLTCSVAFVWRVAYDVFLLVVLVTILVVLLRIHRRQMTIRQPARSSVPSVQCDCDSSTIRMPLVACDKTEKHKSDEPWKNLQAGINIDESSVNESTRKPKKDPKPTIDFSEERRKMSVPGAYCATEILRTSSSVDTSLVAEFPVKGTLRPPPEPSNQTRLDIPPRSPNRCLPSSKGFNSPSSIHNPVPSLQEHIPSRSLRNTLSSIVTGLVSRSFKNRLARLPFEQVQSSEANTSRSQNHHSLPTIEGDIRPKSLQISRENLSSTSLSISSVNNSHIERAPANCLPKHQRVPGQASGEGVSPELRHSPIPLSRLVSSKAQRSPLPPSGVGMSSKAKHNTAQPSGSTTSSKLPSSPVRSSLEMLKLSNTNPRSRSTSPKKKRRVFFKDRPASVNLFWKP